jgi:hypothetical protein
MQLENFPAPPIFTRALQSIFQRRKRLRSWILMGFS